jgi:hypothetical protein
MRFRATQDGYINGIRYYKGNGTTGSHIGSLWNNTGTTRLAQATFTGETSSGWQQVLFSSPVAITAGVTYVASCYSPSGDYAATKPYFTAAVTNGPLVGLADGTDGANGLYRYTATSAFPNSSFQSSNYWVDVVFASATDNIPPTVSSVSPVSGATNVATGTSITAVFSEAMSAASVTTSTFQLKDAASNVIAATVSTSSNQITLTPLAPLAGSSVYTVTITGGVSGVKDLAGNALTTNYSWSFTTAVVDITPPTITLVSPVNAATSVSVGTAVTATFSESMHAASISGATIELRNSSNVLVPATVTYNAATLTATLTPSSSLSVSTLYTATVKSGASGVKDASGNALAGDYVWSFTTGTVTAPPPVTILSFTTRTGTSATSHSLTAIPAGALLVLTTTADAVPQDCLVSSSPSLTWTKRADAAASGSDNSEIWTAVFAAGGSITVTSNWGGGESQSSVCYVILNAEPNLNGAFATAVLQTSPSVTINTTRENSIILGCSADWKAVNGATRTLRDGASESLYFKDGNYTTYHYTKAAAGIGAYTEGVSLPTGQQASTALLEIRSAPAVATRPGVPVTSVNTVLPAAAAKHYADALGQNYPNPSNRSTVIPYTLSKAEKVSLVLLDMQGRVVSVLVNATKDPGNHTVTVNTSSFRKGIYYYRLKTDEYSEVKKMFIW